MLSNVAPSVSASLSPTANIDIQASRRKEIDKLSSRIFCRAFEPNAVALRVSPLRTHKKGSGGKTATLGCFPERLFWKGQECKEQVALEVPVLVCVGTRPLQ